MMTYGTYFDVLPETGTEAWHWQGRQKHTQNPKYLQPNQTYVSWTVLVVAVEMCHQATPKCCAPNWQIVDP